MICPGRNSWYGRRGLVLLALLCGCGVEGRRQAASEPGPGAERGRPVAEERLVHRIPAEITDVTGVVFSPDGGHVALIARSEGGQRVVHDGRPDLLCEEVGGLTFDPSGSRILYKATRAGKQSVVVSGKREEVYDAIHGNPVFAADGATVLVTAKTSGQWFVRMGDRSAGPYEEAGEPICSPRSGKIAYAARMDGKWYVIQGEAKSGGHDFIPGDFIVFDGKGEGVAWVGWEGANRFVVHRGQRGESFSTAGRPAVSADGSVAAYRAQEKEDSRWVLVVGSRKSRRFDWVGEPQFVGSGNQVVCGASEGHQWFVLHADRELKVEGVERIGTPVASSDGSRLAYPASSGREGMEQWWMNVDGRKGPTFAYVGAGRFSSDGRAFCYEARGAKGWLVAGTDQMSNQYDEVWPPAFSKDDQSFSFGARKGRTLYWVTMPASR